MSADYFLKRAAESRCLSIDAARRIRRYAIKKNGDADDVTDINLLPVPSEVKKAFPSHESISQLLRCPCRGLCEPFSAAPSHGEDEELARETWKRKRRLQTFAVLVLSGCVFAYRTFNQHAYAFETLEAFVNAVRNDRETQLRRLLFAPLTADGDDSDETLRSLASKFYRSVTSKLWLIRIPEFVTGGQPQHFRDQRWNFPFLHSELALQSTASHNFRKFIIHEEYFNSTELKNRRVFCKTISFHPEDSVLRDDANREAEILSWMNSLKHPNIAELLFLFTETSEAVHRFNLVFKYHRHTLADMFARARNEELLRRFRPAPPPDAARATLLDHGLWSAMLGVLDGVKAIHEFSASRSGPYEYDEAVEAGHFDIKPANILVAEDGGGGGGSGGSNGVPRLLLADFGQAQLQQRYLNASERRRRGMATLEYAPPECGLGAFSQSRVKASYDIWSLGCLLLEVLVFVAAAFDGHDANADVHQFHLDRLANSEGEAIVSSAFWGGDGGLLRPAVKRRVQMLKDRKDDRLLEVLGHVETMLSINVRDRPNISTCLRALNSDRDLFLRSAHDDMSRRLKDMAISFQTARMFSPAPCNLFVWRESIDREMELTLILEFAASQRWADSKTLKQDALIVQSFYDSRLHYGSSEQRLKVACRFRRLHRGTTFHFEDWKEFFTFFHLMTHQQVAFGKPLDKANKAAASTRWGFRFQSITLGSKAKHERGMVQIWGTNSSTQHSEVFVKPHFASRTLTPERSSNSSRRPSSLTVTSGPEGRTKADARHSRFKLAVFIAREGPNRVVVGETPTCYVLELDLDNILRDDARSTQTVVFRTGERIAGSFPAWAPALDDRGFDGGLPLCPDTLNTAIRSSPATLRLKKVEIVFMTPEECSNFKAALAYYGL